MDFRFGLPGVPERILGLGPLGPEWTLDFGVSGTWADLCFGDPGMQEIVTKGYQTCNQTYWLTNGSQAYGKQTSRSI